MSIESLSVTIQQEIEKAALLALRVELGMLPLSHESSAFLNVQRVQPQLVDDTHLMSFLREEGFVNIAVRRGSLVMAFELLFC